MMLLIVDAAAEPGPLRLTRPVEDEVHILISGGMSVARLQVSYVWGGKVIDLTR
jgi:hypothetical protein